MNILIKIFKVIAYILIFIIGASILFYLALVVFVHPSNNRNWAKDMGMLSYATVDEKNITINNIRDIKYRDVLDYDLAYINEKFDLDKMSKAYFFVDPFDTLSAHTMLGFEFSDGKRVVLSVEVRREVGEWFDGPKGLLRQYEVIYVWSTENDVVKLRTNFRKDNLYMYEMKMSKENLQKLFVEAITRTNKLFKEPEFYNTLNNNCTTNLAELLQKVYNKPIIVDWKYFAPAYAEDLLIKYDLIDGNSISGVRETHNITPLAQKCGECKNYSGEIRKVFNK